MQIVTSADFEQEVLKSKIPVLVDFFADWCGPCKQIAPHLETIAAEKTGKLKIVKVDVDASPELAAQYHIMSMPTLMMIRKGEVISVNNDGAIPKSKIVKWIDNALALPAGTKLDLAPKPVVLSDNDKVRLRDLFNDVVKVLDTPAATEQAVAMREGLKADIASGAVFKQVETVLASTAGALTLDGYIDNIRKTFKIPKAPKP